MKKLITCVAALALCVGIAGCERSPVTRAKQRVDDTAEFQKDAIERSAENRKDEIDANAKAEKRAIERENDVPRTATPVPTTRL